MSATVHVVYLTVPAGRLLRRPKYLETPKQARARGELLARVARDALRLGATSVRLVDRLGFVDAFPVGGPGAVS